MKELRQHRRTRLVPRGALLIACRAFRWWRVLGLVAGVGLASVASTAPLHAAVHRGAFTSWTEAPGQAPAMFAGDFGFDGAHARLQGFAAASRVDGLRSGHVDGRLLLMPLAKRAIELELEAARWRSPEQAAEFGVRGEARLHIASARSGMWIGLAHEQASSVPGQRVYGGGTLLGFGVWTRSRATSVTLGIEQRQAYLAAQNAPAVPTVPETLRAGEQSRENTSLLGTLTTATAHVRWEGERLALETTGGVTMSMLGAPRRWAQAGVRARLTPQVSAFATIDGRGRERYFVAPIEQPRSSVGIQIAQGRPDDFRPLVDRSEVSNWTLRRVDARTYVLGVRAPTARLVEVMGDFTEWEPVALERTGYERWQIVTRLDPGIHQVSLRVDGGPWMPPPGMATTTDAYGMSSGLLVIE